MGALERSAASQTHPGQTPLSSPGDRFYEGAAAGVVALIVDDDFRNLFALSVVLKRGKMVVVTDDSGPLALNVIDDRADVDIVLMDVMMPVMDGYQTIAAIRERPQSSDLPIIAVTGKSGSGERERCVAAGASDYILKPIDAVALATAIMHWLPVGS
jgi:CheY-like chemotaxis protein